MKIIISYIFQKKIFWILKLLTTKNGDIKIQQKYYFLTSEENENSILL